MQATCFISYVTIYRQSEPLLKFTDKTSSRHAITELALESSQPLLSRHRQHLPLPVLMLLETTLKRQVTY